MNKTITSFLKNNSCASICCIDEQGNPYCFSCFYAYNFEDNLLYFKSSASSFHSEIIKKNPLIAGTIQPDKLNKLLTKGIQFEGSVVKENYPLSDGSISMYEKKYPLSIIKSGDIWTVQIDKIKMTDSSFGMFKKFYWNRIDG